MNTQHVDALSVMDLLRLENGNRWGDSATPEQQADAEAVLDPWSHERFFFISRSRGYSKTTDIGAAAVAILLTQAPRGSKSYAVAADQDQARLLLDSIAGFVRRSPALGEAIKVEASRVKQLRSGATLEALAADSASIWGLRPFFIVADELAQWGTTEGPRRVWDAVTSAVPKTGGRLVVITTAGSPSHWSKKVRDHAAEDSLWRLSETTGPPPWMPMAMLAEQKRRLLPSTYARLFENVWTAGEDSLREDDLQACVRLTGPLPPQPHHRYVIGCDLGVVKDRAVAVVAHAEEIREQIDSIGTEATAAVHVYVDRLEVWQGSHAAPVDLSDVETWLLHAAQTYNNAELVADPWQAIAMVQRLRSRGVTVTDHPFTAQSVSRLALALHRAVRDRALWLPDEPGLLDELRRVRLVERTPGQYRIDHAAGEHDDQAVAVSLVVRALLDRDTGPPPEARFTRADPWDTEPGTLAAMYAADERAGLPRLTPGMRL